MPSASWSAESEALHSAEHYGPLKTRLYHSVKALWSAESEAKNHGKISDFRTFLLYLDYELLLRSLCSNKPHEDTLLSQVLCGILTGVHLVSNQFTN